VWKGFEKVGRNGGRRRGGGGGEGGEGGEGDGKGRRGFERVDLGERRAVAAGGRGGGKTGARTKTKTRTKTRTRTYGVRAVLVTSLKFTLRAKEEEGRRKRRMARKGRKKRSMRMARATMYSVSLLNDP
jgi:hypothetical protein